MEVYLDLPLLQIGMNFFLLPNPFSLRTDRMTGVTLLSFTLPTLWTSMEQQYISMVFDKISLILTTACLLSRNVQQRLGIP